jgi:hypothetical protein
MNIQIFKNYTHQGLCRSLDVFNWPDSYPHLTRVLAYRFLFQHKDKDRRLAPSHSQIVNSIKKMVTDNRHTEPSVLMELVDVLLEYSKKDGEELLAFLRRTQLQAKPAPPKTNGPKGTIYADSQSVHNSSITGTIKQAAKYLCTKFRPEIRPEDVNSFRDSIRLKLESNSVFTNDKKILDEVLNRIYNDNALFEGYNVDIILYSIWNWISLQRNDELYNRIAEELYEMHRYCSTRILSGLINSIQGFTDDENLIIKMSPEEQYKTVIYNYLDKKLKECEDEKVIEGMYDKDQYFLNFIIKNIEEKREEWLKEYTEDFSGYIEKYVNMYTQTKLI